MKQTLITSLALGSVLAMGAANVAATENPFEAKPLQQGYQLAEADGKDGEGKCGEGKCGEGKCGEDKEEGKKEEGKCGEGKCGEGKCGSST